MAMVLAKCMVKLVPISFGSLSVWDVVHSAELYFNYGITLFPNSPYTIHLTTCDMCVCRAFCAPDPENLSQSWSYEIGHEPVEVHE